MFLLRRQSDYCNIEIIFPVFTIHPLLPFVHTNSQSITYNHCTCIILETNASGTYMYLEMIMS